MVPRLPPKHFLRAFHPKPRPARISITRKFAGFMVRRRHHGMRMLPGLDGVAQFFRPLGGIQGFIWLKDWQCMHRDHSVDPVSLGRSLSGWCWAICPGTDNLLLQKFFHKNKTLDSSP